MSELQVARWLADCESAVAFTGAGISTASGIPDFRSPGGVWTRFRQVYFDEFLRDEAARREYWRQKCLAHREFAAAVPNRAHEILSQWEQAGRLCGVVTQNIDELHQQAGSQQVLELHGTARKVACIGCGWRDLADDHIAWFEDSGQVPTCPECGQALKHATISFGQALPTEVFATAGRWMRDAHLVLAIGSSLVVHPAADLPQLAAASGARLVIINREPTPLDEIADLVLRAEIVPAMARIADHIAARNA